MSTFLSNSGATEDQLGRNLGEPAEIVGPVVGVLTIALAVSGIVDDTGLLPHPWWAVLVASAAAIGLLVGARTVRALLDMPGPSDL